jgi:aminopeptidase N
MKRFLFSICGLIVLPLLLAGQMPVFTHQDTLRGAITPEREWWDLSYYHLDIIVNPADSTINGKNTVCYRVLNPGKVMQIDLQEPMILKSASQNGTNLEIVNDGNAHFIQMIEEQIPGRDYSLELSFGGKPKVAVRAPWDGGITWGTDNNKLPFIASACQGDGASLWWPCKDHMYDEPDSMLISVNVPSELTDVSNGRLRRVDTLDNNTKTFNWFVSNPISNYGVNINIGDYVNFSETFDGEKGPLDCDFWVLKYNLEKARVYFKQALLMLKAFEYWFGPYPFYEDSYKLVDAPYLGMEHQSCVTYGNGYSKGYRGEDLSRTGWGNTFDFIIVHESGHEWFANNITYRDIADMWVHESFTNYSESLYLEYYNGEEAGNEYVRGTRRRIRNDRPVVGFYDVNCPGSGDMYYKGGNMLHTLRQIVDNDEKWREILRGINKDFYHQTVTGDQIENYLSVKTGINLKPFFDQYLRETRIPVFEYSIKGDVMSYRWNNCSSNFAMPLKVYIDGKEEKIFPVAEWKTMGLSGTCHTVKIDNDYYVSVRQTASE